MHNNITYNCEDRFIWFDECNPFLKGTQTHHHIRHDTNDPLLQRGWTENGCLLFNCLSLPHRKESVQVSDQGPRTSPSKVNSLFKAKCTNKYSEIPLLRPSHKGQQQTKLVLKVGWSLVRDSLCEERGFGGRCFKNGVISSGVPLIKSIYLPPPTKQQQQQQPKNHKQTS